MNLMGIVRILWAWRLLVIGAALASLLGGMYILVTVPPAYEGAARVVLDFLKPNVDAAGSPANSNANGGGSEQKGYAEAYAGTQAQLIRDTQVAGRAAEDLGWLDNPDLQAAYLRRPADDLDFRTWIAQRIVASTRVEMIPDSAILKITFRSYSPEAARTVADAIRKAYIATSVENRQQNHRAEAVWFSAQAERAKARLLELRTAESKMEQETGIVLQRRGSDVDSAQLGRLNMMTLKVIKPQPLVAASRGEGNLAELDGAITQGTSILGPNHPQLQALKQKRAALAARLAKEGGSAATVSSADITRSRIETADRQRSKVLSQNQNLLLLKDMQDEVERARARYNYLASRAALLNQQSTNSEIELTPLRQATGSSAPVYPNRALIIGGGTALGGAIGALLALLFEFLGGRRLRSPADIRSLAPNATIGAAPAFRPASHPIQIRPRWGFSRGRGREAAA